MLLNFGENLKLSQVEEANSSRNPISESPLFSALMAALRQLNLTQRLELYRSFDSVTLNIFSEIDPVSAAELASENTILKPISFQGELIPFLAGDYRVVTLQGTAKYIEKFFDNYMGSIQNVSDLSLRIDDPCSDQLIEKLPAFKNLHNLSVFLEDENKDNLEMLTLEIVKKFLLAKNTAKSKSHTFEQKLAVEMYANIIRLNSIDFKLTVKAKNLDSTVVMKICMALSNSYPSVIKSVKYDELTSGLEVTFNTSKILF